MLMINLGEFTSGLDFHFSIRNLLVNKEYLLQIRLNNKHKTLQYAVRCCHLRNNQPRMTEMKHTSKSIKHAI